MRVKTSQKIATSVSISYFMTPFLLPHTGNKLFLKNLLKRTMDSIKRKSLFVETIEDQKNYLFFSKYKNIPAVKNK